MRKFEKPALEIEVMEVEDIMTTSTNTGGCSSDGCPVDAGEF